MSINKNVWEYGTTRDRIEYARMVGDLLTDNKVQANKELDSTNVAYRGGVHWRKSQFIDFIHMTWVKPVSENFAGIFKDVDEDSRLYPNDTENRRWWESGTSKI